MADGVARVLVDSAGNLVKVTQDGSDYKYEFLGKLRNAAGTVVNPATEDTLSSADAKLGTIDGVLDSIKDTDGIKKIIDALPAGTNNIGKIVLTNGTYDVDVTSSGRLEVSVAADARAVVDVYLLNGSSNEMAVDADPTPQEFVWNPGSNDVEGSALTFVIEDSTIYFGDKFGGISELDNGVLIQVKAQDTVYTIATVYRTRQFSQLAGPGGFDLYAATPDHMKAEISLEGFVFAATGTYATDDYVKVTIRDDIDGLEHMSALFKGREVE